MPKRGRLSNQDVAFITDNAEKLEAVAIATALDRTVETVEEFIRVNITEPRIRNPENEEKVSIRLELRNSEAWKNLKGEFTSEELKYFEEGYIKLMSQFKGDGVMASEETQIFQAIKFEILMSRNLKERRRCRDDISNLENIQTSFLSGFNNDPKNMGPDDKEFSLNLETQLNVARQSEQSRTGEYVKLQERHEALMKSLKSTRDQRIKQVESSKVSFLSVIKLLQDRDVQDRECRQMELMKMAGAREYTRLGRPMKYEDGNDDSPILSADTVDLGPEESVQSEEVDDE